MKKVLVSILTLIFIVSMITIVYAATGSISLRTSYDTVEKGKTFTITVAGTADSNITGLQAKISYDNTKLSIENKSAGTGFTDISGSNEIAIASLNGENLSKSGTLYTITFKVLDTAEEGETKISITNAILALVNEEAVQENTTESSDEVTITVKKETVENQDTNEGKKPDTNEDTTGTEDKEADGEKQEETKKDTTTKKDQQLAQTGIGNTSAIAIIALGLISIISYLLYKKYKNI